MSPPGGNITTMSDNTTDTSIPHAADRAATIVDDGPLIHRALVSALAALPPIGKDSRITNGPSQYNYRGIEDIMPGVNRVFAAYGIHVEPRFRIITDGTYTVKSGAEWVRVVIEGSFTFYATDGSHVTAVTIGEGRDNGDKAWNKAMSAAFKYALTETLAVAGGDDENDSATPDEHVRQPAAPRGAPQAPQAPPAQLEAPEGRILVADAKKALLAALNGDTDAASTAWKFADFTITDHTLDRTAFDQHLRGITPVAAETVPAAPSGTHPAEYDEVAAQYPTLAGGDS